jgi:hypothetical protein
MAWIFRKDENQRHDQLNSEGLFDQNVKVKPAVWGLFLLLFAVLIAGTLQVRPLTTVFTSLQLRAPWITALAARLEPLGLSLQGLMLILMLFVIGITAWKGFETVYERWSTWTTSAIVLITLTILLAALKEDIGSMSIDITGRFVGVFVLLIAIGLVARRNFEQDELSGWIWETWKFVKQIFPLLIVGVFLAGMVRVVIPESWVRTVAGQNTILANFVGVILVSLCTFPPWLRYPSPRCSWTWVWRAVHFWPICWQIPNSLYNQLWYLMALWVNKKQWSTSRGLPSSAHWLVIFLDWFWSVCDKSTEQKSRS